ncbi:P-loop containing nucleoside triphosphate hydrolase protein [Flagelloscypha sp. PMI_526]|nr:P-loop containing nucleoside triphosphate hydrolase protein [Flagelloscypha sp. PMI_526]
MREESQDPTVHLTSEYFKYLALAHDFPVEAVATAWVKKCPSPSPNFTGRRAELDHMHAYFSSAIGSSSRIYVIYGLGGSGKTQLLLQFVQESQNQSPRMFDAVFFADASLETTLETDLKAIAVDRNVGKSAVDAVQWLSYQNNRWVLVFDNADDKAFSIQKYIPKSIHGNVIITSRNPELAGLASNDLGARRIGDMEKLAAKELLRKLVQPGEIFSDRDDSLIAQVVDMLNCFALAVTQAGSYMSATGSGYQEYIELLQQDRPRLLREGQGQVIDNYSWSIYTTWAISFTQLKTASRHFMQICSYLHSSGIPKDLFMYATESDPLTSVDERTRTWLSEFMNHTRNDEGLWNPVAFDEIIQDVMSFSLAIQVVYGEDFPDVQCALQLVALAVPGINDRSLASVLLKRRLQSHLDALVPGASHVSSVPMALRLSAIYEQTGRWHDVANIFERAKEIGGFGGNWSLGACTSNLAVAYGHLGRQEEALDLQLSVLADQRQTLGDDHPDTLTSMNNLASTYHVLGRHAEALDLRLSVLAYQKVFLGDEHPRTLTSMNNLASTYRACGRLEEALDLDRLVLANRKRILGNEHPDTLTSMNNLASTYHTLGMHDDALNLLLLVLANDKQTLGDQHPHTLSSMSNLASTYLACGRPAEALDLQLSVLAVRERILGAEHIHTLLSMNNLASTYYHLGRYIEALGLQLSVLANQKLILGDEHPHTLSSMNNLASTCHALERRSEATGLLVAAVNIATRVLGAEHPTTLSLQQRLEISLSPGSGEVDNGSFEEELGPK